MKKIDEEIIICTGLISDRESKWWIEKYYIDFDLLWF